MSATSRRSFGLNQIQSWTRRNGTKVTLLSGSLIVILWTVLRHITNGVNFDIVGQIGLADQWARGQSSGAQVGSTNYLLKMPLYWLVNHLGILSPHAKLLVLALLFNLLTWLLIFVLFVKILELLDVQARSWLYLSLIWLATISGRTYWLDYANSRNLETIGGILFLYLSIKFMKKRSRRDAGWLVLVGSVVFFADPLQFFIIATPVCLYATGGWLIRRTRDSFRLAAYLIGLTGLGYAASKLLFWLTSLLLPVSYLAVPRPIITFTGQTVWLSIRETGLSTLKNFDAYFFKPPLTPNSIREFLNALVLATIIVLFVNLLANKSLRVFPRGLVLSVILVNYLVYAGSGQALQWETSRYLVMVPLVSLLAVSIWGDVFAGNRKQILQSLWAGSIFISCLLLLGALIISWPKRYSNDAYIGNALVYMQQHNYKYAVSSRGLGIPGTYFAGGRVIILPVICSGDHRLHSSNLFYDQAAFSGLSNYRSEIPVILQANDIISGDFHCKKVDVITQFGSPKHEEVVPGVGTAEIYDAGMIRLTN